METPQELAENTETQIKEFNEWVERGESEALLNIAECCPPKWNPASEMRPLAFAVDCDEIDFSSPMRNLFAAHSTIYARPGVMRNWLERGRGFRDNPKQAIFLVDERKLLSEVTKEQVTYKGGRTEIADQCFAYRWPLNGGASWAPSVGSLPLEAKPEKREKPPKLGISVYREYLGYLIRVCYPYLCKDPIEKPFVDENSVREVFRDDGWVSEWEIMFPEIELSKCVDEIENSLIRVYLPKASLIQSLTGHLQWRDKELINSFGSYDDLQSSLVVFYRDWGKRNLEKN